MYCSKCDRAAEGNFCAFCGGKNYTRKEAYVNWKNVYESYSITKLEEIIENEAEYQEDAVLAAKELVEKAGVRRTINAQAESFRDWYYVSKGERKGPVTEAHLVELYLQDKITRTTQVWCAGMMSWIDLSLSGISLPQRYEASPPPIEAKYISNIPVAVLCVVPLIATLIQYLIAGVMQIDVNGLWWIAWIINSICCFVDCNILKKAGYRPDKAMEAFIVLIPLYIYRRMKLVGGKRWFFTGIWIVVFVIDLMIPMGYWVKTVGISNPAMITSVQGGKFDDFPEATIGQLFGKNLDNEKWTTYVGSRKRIFVKVTGKMEGESFEAVFEIDPDGILEITSMEMAGENFSNQDMNWMLSYFAEQY